MGVIKDEVIPAKFLADSLHPEASADPPDLLILNQPISHFDRFARLWKHTGYRICADGGANRLFDMFEGDLVEQRGRYVGVFSSRRRGTDCNSCLTSFTVTLTHCVMMFVHITQSMACRCLRITISTAQTLERTCRKFPRELQTRRRKMYSFLGPWQVE
jgi:hypothetical protein